MMTNSHTNTGFSLLEVLIALLILAVGLLGMASLMLHSMKSNQSSYQRTQASLLAYDMAERLRLNPTIATAGNNYVIASTASPGSAVTCPSSTCTAAQSSAVDVYEWSKAINDQQLSGTVARNGNLYTINVSWDVSFTAADSGCGAGQCSFELKVNL
ncbi:type IV pilus modification protein PilV [Pseudomonas sp.]|uniref:type IV pilus modification protein PilV n=1 Tax=Pseudomonas sp. TaxID=306 RepID=UPI003BB54604